MSYEFVFPEFDGPALTPEKDQIMLQLLLDAIDSNNHTIKATQHFMSALNTVNLSMDEIITFLSSYLMGYIVEKGNNASKTQ